ncbi:MAG: beta-propeller fold lactonase family protein [Anaerolineae bacterium]|nr:beta-propeller fold lactonase family protein [Anaerolineae bacterium]
MMRKGLVPGWAVTFLLLLSLGSQAAEAPSAAPKRSSSPIALMADGATLLVVNPDSNSLALVDTASRSVLAEVPVGVDPRTVAVDDAGRRAYVANRGSGSVSVVDLAAGEAIAAVSVGYRPYGVVVSPDGATLYVAVQGADRLVTLDTTTLEVVSARPVGDRPSGLALTPAGDLLFITHLLSDQITILPTHSTALYLPLILKHAPSISNIQYPISSPHSPIPDISLFPDSNLVQSVALSPDGSTAYVPHTRSNSSNPALTFDTTVFPLVSLIDVAARQHLVGQQIDLGTLDPPGVGLPFDAALAPGGAELWVVNAASNDLSVIDLAHGRLAAHVEVGDNPRGIVLSPDGGSAYVNNTLAGTVSVIDTAAYTVTGVITVTDIPLPPILLNGKRLFHTSDDPRLAKNQWISCNTCHFEGEHDGRTWTFGFAGPRNTTGLMGMIETYPLRWSGEWDESADSDFANRKENFGSGLIDGALNCALSPPDCVHQPPNQGRTDDMDSLALFLDSLAVPLSAGHAAGEPLTPAEQRGRDLFLDAALGCVPCHPPPLYTDHQRHDVGTATPGERIGPDYDTPTLRGLWDSAPYFHDGSAAALYDALTRPTPGSEHDVSSLLTGAEIQDLIVFLLALPFDR